MTCHYVIEGNIHVFCLKSKPIALTIQSKRAQHVALGNLVYCFEVGSMLWWVIYLYDLFNLFWLINREGIYLVNVLWNLVATLSMGDPNDFGQVSEKLCV